MTTEEILIFIAKSEAEYSDEYTSSAHAGLSVVSNITPSFNSYNDTQTQKVTRFNGAKMTIIEKDIKTALTRVKMATPNLMIKPEPQCKEINDVITKVNNYRLRHTLSDVEDLVFRSFLGILDAEKGYQCYFVLPWSTDFGNCILLSGLPAIKNVKGTPTKTGLYLYTVGTGAGGVTGLTYAISYLRQTLASDGISVSWHTDLRKRFNHIGDTLAKGFYGVRSKDWKVNLKYFKSLNEKTGVQAVSIYENEKVITAATTSSGRFSGPNLSPVSVMELHALIDGSFKRSVIQAMNKVVILSKKDKDIFIAYVNHLHQNSSNAETILKNLASGSVVKTTKNTTKASDYNLSRYKAFKKYLYGELQYV